MKKAFITLFIFLFGLTKAIACDCDISKPILEFYTSKHVVTGKVIKKEFSKDSLTYTITFKVEKSFKKGKIPEKLTFRFNYPKGGIGDSCYWEVYVNQELLLYVHETNGKLWFGKMCFNSHIINDSGISTQEKKIFEHANNFKLDDYIYGNESDVREEFNFPKPITDIDSIFKNTKEKRYEKPSGLFALPINKKGELISVFNFFDWHKSSEDFIIDPVFGLMKEFHVTSKRPLTEFETDGIELLKKVKMWELKRNKITQVPVDYIAYVYLEIDEKTMKWKYELR